jgi:very-short-patch-repair endonuclease
MKIIGLDEREHKWNPSHAQASFNDSNKSKLHLRAREIIKEIYPNDRVLEEVTLPGSRTQSRNSLLYADFFIPNRNMIVEAHGEQHMKYNSHFYKDKMQFIRAKARDRDKKEWCNLNDITLVELFFDEDEDDWRRKIQ